MNNSQNDTTAQKNTQPSESFIIVGVEEIPLKDQAKQDFYHAMRKFFNAPINFFSGVCLLPTALVQSWSNSKHDRNTVSHYYGISPMSLLWLLLAGGTVGSVMLFCFGDVKSVTGRVADNLKALQQAPDQIQATLQPPATPPYTDYDMVISEIERQAQKEAFEQACRTKGGEVFPGAKYFTGVNRVWKGDEGDEYQIFTTILIPTGNTCTFPPGKAAEAFKLEQLFNKK